MNNIERLIDILFDYVKERRSNIMILHDEETHTKMTALIDNYERLQNYARAMVNSDAKAAEKLMVCIAEALEEKELKKH